MKFTVTAQVKGFTGRRAGVDFVNGSVTLDDDDPAQARALAWCLRRDYDVTAEDVGELVDAEIDAGGLQVVTVTDTTPGELERPKDNGSTADWMAYAASLGFAPEDPEEDPTRGELQAWVRKHENEAAAEADGPADPAVSGEE